MDDMDKTYSHGLNTGCPTAVRSKAIVYDDSFRLHIKACTYPVIVRHIYGKYYAMPWAVLKLRGHMRIINTIKKI